jgi:hypothetical protein
MSRTIPRDVGEDGFGDNADAQMSNGEASHAYVEVHDGQNSLISSPSGWFVLKDVFLFRVCNWTVER